MFYKYLATYEQTFTLCAGVSRNVICAIQKVSFGFQLIWKYPFIENHPIIIETKSLDANQKDPQNRMST